MEFWNIIAFNYFRLFHYHGVRKLLRMNDICREVVSPTTMVQLKHREILFFWCMSLMICSVLTDVIKIGYITGSKKLPFQGFYRQPGQAISGALTYAIEQINNNTDILPGRTLQFILAETYGQESESIRQTVELLNDNISVYFGPQETCTYEARIAAVFNVPMISYVSRTFLFTHLCYSYLQIRSSDCVA